MMGVRECKYVRILYDGIWLASGDFLSHSLFPLNINLTQGGTREERSVASHTVHHLRASYLDVPQTNCLPLSRQRNNT